MEIISTKEYLNYKSSTNNCQNYDRQNASTVQPQLTASPNQQHTTDHTPPPPTTTTYLVCGGYEGLEITDANLVLNQSVSSQAVTIGQQQPVPPPLPTINTTFNNDFEFTKAPLTPLTNSYFNLDHLDLCLPFQIAPNKCINTQSQQQQQQPIAQMVQPPPPPPPPTTTSQPPGLIRSISTPSFSLKFSSSLPNLVFKSATVLDDIENQIDNVTISEQPLVINQTETTPQFTANSILFDLNLDENETENDDASKDVLLIESNILADKTTAHQTNDINTNENQQQNLIVPHFVSDTNKPDLGVDLKYELSSYYTSVYTCFHRSCGMDFNTKESIIEHIKEIHRNKSKNTSDGLVEIDSNYLEGNTKFMFKCLYDQFCNKKMDNLNKLINHICKAHLENGVLFSNYKKFFICSYDDCLLSFNNESSLNKHKQIHKSNKTSKTYVCNICQSTFVRPSHLTNHLKVHENMKLKCDYCDERFMKQSLLIQHLFDKHKHTPKTIKCTECDKEFISRMHLKSHYKKVHETRNQECLKCSYCEKVFDLPWLKRSHEELVHKKVKKYVCTHEGCNKAFSTSSKLNRHNLTHSSVKQFKCTKTNCTAEFNRKDHLLSHLKSHSDEKSFVCDYPNCNSTFKYQSNLQAHKKTHLVATTADNQEELNCQTNSIQLLENTNEKPNKYKCEICNEQFKTKLMFNIHKKDHKKKSKLKPILSQQQENNEFEPGLQENELLHEIPAKHIKLNINCSKTNYLKNNSERLKHKHVIIMNSDDEEYAPTSVVLENLSGSARTDYKSNHMYIERSRIRQQERRNQIDNSKNKFKPIQEFFNNETSNNNTPNNEHIIQVPAFSKTFNANLTCSSKDNDLMNNIDTSRAIYIKDPITGNTIIQTQLLQDDPPYFLDVTDKSY